MLEAGIAATNSDGDLLTAKAGILINEEDFDGAIALYQQLYDRDTSNTVIANNLASLISSHRSDPESLDRAFAIARRLRGSVNPYFQDTYGWLLTRRDDSQQALTYLEPAAKALATDPLVQYHLGLTYLALERWDDARATLARAVEVAGAESDLPQIADARTQILAIDSKLKGPAAGK